MNPPGAVGTVTWDKSPFGLFDVGGIPSELAKDGDEIVIRGDCMCNRRFCVHPAYEKTSPKKMKSPGNWTFRCVKRVTLAVGKF